MLRQEVHCKHAQPTGAAIAASTAKRRRSRGVVSRLYGRVFLIFSVCAWLLLIASLPLVGANLLYRLQWIGQTQQAAQFFIDLSPMTLAPSATFEDSSVTVSRFQDRISLDITLAAQTDSAIAGSDVLELRVWLPQGLDVSYADPVSLGSGTERVVQPGEAFTTTFEFESFQPVPPGDPYLTLTPAAYVETSADTSLEVFFTVRLLIAEPVWSRISLASSVWRFSWAPGLGRLTGIDGREGLRGTSTSLLFLRSSSVQDIPGPHEELGYGEYRVTFPYDDAQVIDVIVSRPSIQALSDVSQWVAAGAAAAVLIPLLLARLPKTSAETSVGREQRRERPGGTAGLGLSRHPLARPSHRKENPPRVAGMRRNTGGK